MKKKRSTPSKSSRSRDRSPQSGDEIISARDRFKGALQELLPHSEEESDASDEELWPTKPKRMSLQKKRQTLEKLDDSNKYVMKLFDRSVDLAQFNENTPLYPICRAWIANQPHMIYNIKKEKDPDDDKEEPYVMPENGGDYDLVRDTYRLPPPESATGPSLRIPQLILYATDYPDIPKESSEPIPKENLLADNIEHWRKVRRSWMEASARNDVRYDKSLKILTAMYNKAQKQFQN